MNEVNWTILIEGFGGQIASSVIVSTALSSAILNILIDKGIISREEAIVALHKQKDYMNTEESKNLYDHAIGVIIGT